MHVLGCYCQAIGVTAPAFPLLVASRLTHGYTILLFPLSVVWIGAREVAEQKAITLAQRNAYSTLGIFFGIVAGSMLAAAAPTSMMAGAAPGVLNLVVSAVMLVWMHRVRRPAFHMPAHPAASHLAPGSP